MSGLGTRSLAERRVAASQSSSPLCPAFMCCIVVPLIVLYMQQSHAAPQAPVTIIESVKSLQPIADDSTQPPPARAATRPARSAVVERVPSSAVDAAQSGPVAEHESMQPMAVLNRERAKAGGGAFASAFRVYRPAPGAVRPGGDLDEPETLPRAVSGSAADGEVMLLCIGGSGSMRTGLNLVLNFRSMGLYHMLILAPEKAVCEELWDALPSLACVWWPSQFTAPRPKSLYNTMFSRIALAFFEARKRYRKHRHPEATKPPTPRSPKPDARRSTPSPSPSRPLLTRRMRVCACAAACRCVWMAVAAGDG
jgi:hypothetical protein